MTILVTGGTGLVGLRLLKRLMDAGVECRALVRGHKPLPAGVTAVEGDILDRASLAGALEGVSAVVHLAAVFRTRDEDLIWRVNLDGTRNLVDAAKVHAPDARFIMASTSNVYGMGGAHPGREDDAVEPVLAYPASKLAAENVLRSSGLNWSILRFGFVYGDRDGHIESLPGYMSDGTWHPAQRMSMVHHQDIATAMRLALDGALDREVVNIVDDAPASLYELFAIAGARMNPSAAPLPNPWRLVADSTHARSLGFQPLVATVHQAVREGLL
jgi:UDP-glucose 4-epimerase